MKNAYSNVNVVGEEKKTKKRKSILPGRVDQPDTDLVLGEDWFKEGEWFVPSPKVAISIRIDKDVVEWFKAKGAGYQSRMNAVLKAYVKAHS